MSIEKIKSSVGPRQRVNQLPGISEVSNKGKLARNLNRMRQVLPDEYNFFPEVCLSRFCGVLTIKSAP